MKEYPHGCDADYEHEQIAEAMYAAHLDGECKPPCDYCEAEAENKPVCQDCGEKALPGYVAGDRCERCGGRLDKETEEK